MYLTATTTTVNSIPIVVITLIISVTSLLFAVYQWAKKSAKEEVKDARDQTSQDTSRMTEVIVKLDRIQSDITDLSHETKDIKQDINVLRDRLTRVEMTADSAHRRLDDFVKKNGECSGSSKKTKSGSSEY